MIKYVDAKGVLKGYYKYDNWMLNSDERRIQALIGDWRHSRLHTRIQYWKHMDANKLLGLCAGIIDLLVGERSNLRDALSGLVIMLKSHKQNHECPWRVRTVSVDDALLSWHAHMPSTIWSWCFLKPRVTTQLSQHKTITTSLHQGLFDIASKFVVAYVANCVWDLVFDLHHSLASP